MKLVNHTVEGFDDNIERLRALDPNKKWEIVVKPYRKKRTNDQLAYWWGVVVRTICDESGNDKDDIHDFLCGEYFGWVKHDVFGKQKMKPVRTLTAPQKLPRDDMTRFIDWCVAWAAQHGIMVPFPNEEMT